MYTLLISANPLYKVTRKKLRYSKYDFMPMYFLSLWSWTPFSEYPAHTMISLGSTEVSLWIWYILRDLLGQKN